MTENLNKEEVKKDLNEGRELEYEESKLIIEDKVVAKIARIAINNVDGILDMKGNIADSIGSFFGSNDRSTAVSYTHLDVYKRQKQKRPKGL